MPGADVVGFLEKYAAGFDPPLTEGRRGDPAPAYPHRCLRTGHHGRDDDRRPGGGWRPGRTTTRRSRGWPSACRPGSSSCTPRSTVTRTSCRRARCWWSATGQSGCQIAEDLFLAGAHGASGRRRRAPGGPPLPGPGHAGLARPDGATTPRASTSSPTPTRCGWRGQPLHDRPGTAAATSTCGTSPGAACGCTGGCGASTARGCGSPPISRRTWTTPTPWPTGSRTRSTGTSRARGSWRRPRPATPPSGGLETAGPGGARRRARPGRRRPSRR